MLEPLPKVLSGLIAQPYGDERTDIMTKSGPTIHTLDVAGARLYYEIRGSGPLLLLLGSPMDSTGFAGIAAELADSHRVVSYDPRGISNSTREDPTQDLTPELQANDVHQVLSELGGGPAYACSAAAAEPSWGWRWSRPTQTRCGRLSPTNLR
jgi:hypothetical protein